MEKSCYIYCSYCGFKTTITNKNDLTLNKIQVAPLSKTFGSEETINRGLFFRCPKCGRMAKGMKVSEEKPIEHPYANSNYKEPNPLTLFKDI